MIRVLIVDDDKLARMGLLTMLPWAEHGMEVVGEAANGAKALEFLRDGEADLCFVDLMMPVMPGLEFIRAARALYPQLQFVVLTFHEDFSFVQAALRLGVLDYISKLELEHADFGQILRRLTARIGTEPPEDIGGADGVPFEAELLSRRWLFDDCALGALQRRIEGEGAPLPAIERLLVRAVLLIEADARLSGPPVPQLSSAGQAASYLARYRDALLARAEAAADLGCLTACLLRAVAAVGRDLSADLHTDAVAARVGLSRPYFSASFSKEAGIPFNAFVRRQRVREAQRLLKETEWPVGEVAARVGYEDARAFSRQFQELSGATPSQYRARQR